MNRKVGKSAVAKSEYYCINQLFTFSLLMLFFLKKKKKISTRHSVGEARQKLSE